MGSLFDTTQNVVNNAANPTQANHNWGDWQGHYFDTVLHDKGVTGINDTSQGSAITQTKQQFLDKYKDAIGTDGNFIPGKANLYYDNENAGSVYDNLIGYHSGDGKTGGYFAPSVDAGWVKDDRPAGYLAQHGVNPDTLKIAALLAAGVATGGFGFLGEGSLLGAGAMEGTVASELAGGAALEGGAAASGLAGSLGMSAGYGATALNAGALNTGMSLLGGNNIGDSLKQGATSALLSPIAGFTGDAVGGGMLGNIAGNSALGGASSLLRGGDVMTGIRNGAVNGAVSSAGQFIGNQAGDAATEFGKPVSQFVSNAANQGSQTLLRGGDLGRALTNSATQGIAQYTSSNLSPYVGDIAANAITNAGITGLKGGNVGNSLLNSGARAVPGILRGG